MDEYVAHLEAEVRRLKQDVDQMRRDLSLALSSIPPTQKAGSLGAIAGTIGGQNSVSS